MIQLFTVQLPLECICAWYYYAWRYDDDKQDIRTCLTTKKIVKANKRTINWWCLIHFDIENLERNKQTNILFPLHTFCMESSGKRASAPRHDLSALAKSFAGEMCASQKTPTWPRLKSRPKPRPVASLTLLGPYHCPLGLQRQALNCHITLTFQQR